MKERNMKERNMSDKVETEVAATPKKKSRKLAKSIEGNVLTVTESTTGEVMKFDFVELPEKIQELFGPYGMSQKLGDAAAGKAGQVAIDAITKVWESLMKGDWSVRAPASEKISKNAILDTYNAMPEGKEKVVFKGLLVKLGVIKEA